MELYKLTPHIRHARRHIAKIFTRREVTICYDARLFYFEKVEGFITANGAKYNVSNKTALYLPPLTRYTFNLKFSQNSEITVFNFDLTDKYSHIRQSFGTPTVTEFDPSLAPIYPVPSEFSSPLSIKSKKIAPLISSSLESFTRAGGVYLDRASAYLKLVLLELIDSTELSYSKLCTSVMEYVSLHYNDPQMTNASVAEAMNYHPYYINRVVKSELGRPLRAYIIDYRLERAKELLLSLDDNVSEIALKSGFSSSSYFVKLFKEKESVTPLEYRKKNASLQL